MSGSRPTRPSPDPSNTMARRYGPITEEDARIRKEWQGVRGARGAGATT